MEGAVVQKKVGVSQMLLATVTRFNKALTLWCVFALFVIEWCLHRLFAEVCGVSSLSSQPGNEVGRQSADLGTGSAAACGSLPSFCC